MFLPQNVIKYIKSLMCVFENANCVSLSHVAHCSHDSLSRVLNGKKFCWQTLLRNFLLRTFGKLQGGWLMIDDTTISKRFSKKIEHLSWVFDSKIGKSILGLQMVMLAWSNGKITIPLAIKVYQKNGNKSKIDLACELLTWAKHQGIRPDFVAFDSWYAASQLFKTVKQCKWEWVSRLKSNRKLDGRQLKESQRNPYWMKTGIIAGGHKALVVRHGKQYFASSNLSLSKKELLACYKARWNIETVFKALHSKLGLDDCQARKLSAQTAHFHLCLFAYIALERVRIVKKKSIYDMKRQCSFKFKTADNIVSKLFFQGA